MRQNLTTFVSSERSEWPCVKSGLCEPQTAVHAVRCQLERLLSDVPLVISKSLQYVGQFTMYNIETNLQELRWGGVPVLHQTFYLPSPVDERSNETREDTLFQIG